MLNMFGSMKWKNGDRELCEKDREYQTDKIFLKKF
jgi:hypothetical protein